MLIIKTLQTSQKKYEMYTSRKTNQNKYHDP